MRRREQARTLKDIVSVRRAQQTLAEMAAARAASNARQIAETRDGCLQTLDEDQQQWARTMGEPHACIDRTRLWIAVVAQGEAELRALDVRAADADRDRIHRLDVLSVAIGRTDVASSLARQAIRALNRREEETRLDTLPHDLNRGRP